MQKILDHLYLFRDTCNVYVIQRGTNAVLIDFGSGDVLDHLGEIGVENVSDVLLTHHHRDQAQGLWKAREAGINIWVPDMERDLFQHADVHWQERELYVNYNMRQDRFSLLKSVSITGTLKDYQQREFGGCTFTVIPTPGHTIGSISLLLDCDGQPVAFTGDLIAAPGKVWMMSATQWTYNGAEGVAASIPSLLDLKDRQPNLLLPAHGDPIPEPAAAIDLLVERFWELLQLRGHNLNLLDIREKPYEAVTPHLLRHRSSFANYYVLLSENKKALFLDFGYDFVTGYSAGFDRASRRPWLYSLPALKRQFGVERIDVVVPTHFHDDHIAGINLLRQEEGTRVWSAERFADILERPADYDLPCLWYDPIPVDRRLPLEVPFQWEEYTLTLFPLTGHTLYAVAIRFEVDGRKVLATGDQYQSDAGLQLNYVYPNRFEAADYVKSANLYKTLNPDLILTGHWKPFWVPPGYYDQLERMGADLERLHHALLLDVPNLGTEGFLARIMPYQSVAHGNEKVEFVAEVRNPYDKLVEGRVKMVVPPDWEIVHIDAARSMAGTAVVWMEPLSVCRIKFCIEPPPDFSARRARVAVDVTIDGQRFGQQAEALVSSTD
ncbi:MAG TPA: MBL fold metallo-hydrolase [Phototrophicaceae bacterium]|nr:MBL fold metallo-hydrolase [Phototrophicaceae bacterium]